jgi:hypothetical protein
MSHHAGRSDLVLFSFPTVSQAAEGWLAPRLHPTNKKHCQNYSAEISYAVVLLDLVNAAINITGGRRDDNIGYIEFQSPHLILNFSLSYT